MKSSWLGKANGIFSLTDSDRFVGSYVILKPNLDSHATFGHLGYLKMCL